jgi:hypothetical protein
VRGGGDCYDYVAMLGWIRLWGDGELDGGLDGGLGDLRRMGGICIGAGFMLWRRFCGYEYGFCFSA